MATSDTDVDALISRLSGPLLPPARIAFRAAALDALARVPCLGEGAIYRAVASLQRQFWDPPSDHSTGHLLGVGSRRPSKLASAAPIGADDVRTGARDRHRFRAE
jgi:hypothetical protein